MSDTPFQYQEGGGKFPPYQEDYFQRIVNVQWLGAAGVATAHVQMGDFCCFSCYVEAPLKGPYTKKPLGSPIYGPHGDIYAGSYHKVNDKQPTFLMGGNTDGTVSPRGGVITWSPDGQSVILTYQVELPTGPEVHDSFAAIQGIVWDETQFWACAHTTITYYTSDGTTWVNTVDTDILLSSTDGQHWAVVDSRVTAVNSPSGETHDPTQMGLLTTHCNPRVLDRNGNAVPDGIYHYETDPVTGITIFIQPDVVPAIDYTYGGAVFTGLGRTITIKVTESGRMTTTNVDTGIIVACVAYADGVITAAGEDIAGEGPPAKSAFAISTDMGATWKQDSYSPDFAPVLTVNAAPNRDFVKNG